MPIQIDHGIKGKEYPPYAVTVERGKIKEFARAIGDESPFYLDDEVGRASPWGHHRAAHLSRDLPQRPGGHGDAAP